MPGLRVTLKAWLGNDNRYRIRNIYKAQNGDTTFAEVIWEASKSIPELGGIGREPGSFDLYTIFVGGLDLH